MFANLSGRAAMSLLAAAVVFSSIAPAAVHAQKISARQIAFGKRIYQTKANCIFCHGWSGNGEGQERAPRPGLSLRDTKLTRDQLIEVVQCGRPGTAMPYHDAFAYTDKRCYGMTADEMGDQIPNRTDANTLQKREIEAVVDYLLAKIVGRGPITKAECEEFWSPGADACKKYQ
jgi:cytochrome c553